MASFEENIYEFFKKFKFLDIQSRLDGTYLALHFFIGSTWALLFTVFCYFSLWFLMSIPVYIGYVFWKEFISDGHLKRMRNGTETEGDKADLYSDLLTHLIGLLFYLMVLIY